MSYPIRVRASALIVCDESILLVEFNDENGLHYNLPAGGVERGESVIQAVKREAREETSADVEVGTLVFVYEYEPNFNIRKYGSTHTLDMVFECSLIPGSKPRMPLKPDPDQTAVKWVKLCELGSLPLYPNITSQIIQYARNGRNGTTFLMESLFGVVPQEAASRS